MIPYIYIYILMHVCIDYTVVLVLNDVTYKVTFQFIKIYVKIV